MRRPINNIVARPVTKPSASRSLLRRLNQVHALYFLSLIALAIVFGASSFYAQKASIPLSTPVAFDATPRWNATLVSPLSAADIETYTQALQAQKKSDWKQVDALIASLQDKTLVSSLLADRYLSKHYKSSEAELTAWLDENTDHPQAQAISRWTVNKNAKLRTSLPEVADTTFSARVIDDGKHSVLRDNGRVSIDPSIMGQQVANRVLITLDTESPESALRMVEQAQQARAIGSQTAASLKGKIGQYYFNRSQYRSAYPLFQAATGNGDAAASHIWMAGISAFHMKQYNTAAKQFSRLSKQSNLPVADKAAAHYWNYLASKKAGKTTAAANALEQAKKYPRSFYGILALKASGENLTVTNAASEPHNSLMGIEGVRRAAVWMALGKRDRAEEELKALFANAASEQKPEFVKLASYWSMPTLQMKMGHALRANGETLDFALYPTPGWKPHAGYEVDPALLYAIARQESKFENDVRSPAGARGVMQLMPNTANYIAKDAGLKKESVRGKLDEPVTSVTLGQEYVQYLMDKPYIRNNLVFITAAYNAGPGKVSEWQGRIDDNGDPLLFMESISFSETRNYVQQVMANYWIYSALMGTQAPSLEALAANNWPLYEVNNLEFAGQFGQNLN
jgi:soluble lytic murein transglycosylase